MLTQRPCRLIVDEPRNGVRNMAIDEALLWSAATEGTTTLRFYRWSEPTLSVGYFQAAADRARHAASLSCPLIRRRSGGGAILHHYELTYSLAIPAAELSDKYSRQLYLAFHETLAATLAEVGLPCQIAVAEPSRDDQFLCFARRASGDLLRGGDKICGSAQRRRRNALLQHGSVLLRRSPWAPELPGIGDLAAENRNPPPGNIPLEPLLSFDSLVSRWTPRLFNFLKIAAMESRLTDKELSEADRAADQMFALSEWNLRR